MTVPAGHRTLLLDLAAPARTADPQALAALDDGEWQALWDVACAHRIDPLLHAQFRNGAVAGVPQWFRDRCKTRFEEASFGTIRIQRELLLLHRALMAAGIGFVAMKGAYLAFHAYAESALRPLRDLDILVARDDAMPAYRALLARGLAPLTEGGDVEEVLKLKHQLPPLLSAETGMLVEIHHRAFHGEEHEPDLTGDPGFIGRLVTRDLGGQNLRFMGAEDLLLHLIVHSVYDHRFDNGPGILADIAALLGTHRIDWPLFWTIAERQGRARGAIFALRMASDYWGELPIDWVGREDKAQAIPASAIAAAAVLSLRDLGKSADLKLAEATRQAGGTGTLLRKLFPRPALLRSAYPNRGLWRDLPGLYLKKWRTIAMTRLPSFARMLRDDANRDDKFAMQEVQVWLDAKT
jgi:Uncharacterised nucleotidyltransferase